MAISIPDELSKDADRLAAHDGVSRDDLYTRALTEYVRGRRNQSMTGKEITDSLNRLAARIDTSLPPDLNAASMEVLRHVEWKDD